MDLPKTMMSNVAATGQGSRTMVAGSNSMPTDTKNSTANASRNGSDSSAARWLSADSLRIIPAKTQGFNQCPADIHPASSTSSGYALG
jgi:hypothetical protein